MSKNNPTNRDLSEKLDTVVSNQKEFEKSIRKEMQVFRDFMIVQVDRQKRSGNNGAMVVVKQAITALVVALGILGVVIQALSKG